MKNEPENESTPLAADTIIGSAVKIKGDLISTGNVSIHGAVEGQVQTDGDVVVGDSAKLSAQLTAQNAQIAGQVRGNITVAGLLKLTASASVHGDISAQTLEIEPGAVFVGKSSMAKENGEKTASDEAKSEA